MIIVLAIIIMLLIIWSVYSAGICIDEYEMEIDFKCDTIIVILSKLYWWIIGISCIGILLFTISYWISKGIVCSLENVDNPECIKLEEAKNEN